MSSCCRAGHLADISVFESLQGNQGNFVCVQNRQVNNSLIKDAAALVGTVPLFQLVDKVGSHPVVEKGVNKVKKFGRELFGASGSVASSLAGAPMAPETVLQVADALTPTQLIDRGRRLSNGINRAISSVSRKVDNNIKVVGPALVVCLLAQGLISADEITEIVNSDPDPSSALAFLGALKSGNSLRSAMVYLKKTLQGI